MCVSERGVWVWCRELRDSGNDDNDDDDDGKYGEKMWTIHWIYIYIYIYTFEYQTQIYTNASTGTENEEMIETMIVMGNGCVSYIKTNANSMLNPNCLDFSVILCLHVRSEGFFSIIVEFFSSLYYVGFTVNDDLLVKILKATMIERQ